MFSPLAFTSPPVPSTLRSLPPLLNSVVMRRHQDTLDGNNPPPRCLSYLLPLLAASDHLSCPNSKGLFAPLGTPPRFRGRDKGQCPS
ncbi:hypothetical protein B0H16DRAFT_1739635 [Mycena metata]|uniref:Uncharacterized protein n=1 Tax=Mycena metata TaxID=1033252 RepID=A0AAD7HEW3_9AGAR|nr:hypothetical protein B0H16DRAFT_1739635 [Mycena metata]